MKAVGCKINFLCTVFITGFLACHGDDNEYRLLQYLLSNYDSSARPAANSSQPMQVVFGMSLHLIIDVDERNQILTTNCWLTQIWNDSHLTWNASDFGGIRVVRIPYHRVWRPDIILYNNADAQYGSSIINTNVIVSETGQVVWLSHGIFRSSCDINVEYFPFDLQSCKMKWASWTYDGYQIDLVKQTEVGDVSNYQPNGEFDLVGFEAIRHVEFYSCCPEPYPDITFVIKMRRRPMFYVFNLILPCILINGIALLVFYVPSESGEKVTLGISALLSMTVFLMTIRESLPPTEKTPLISLYYGVSICLVSFASGLSVVTLNLHHRGLRGTEVPYLLKRIILGGLARLVFLRFDSPKSETAASTNSNNSESCGCSKNKTSDSAINKPDRNIQKNNWSVTSSSNGGIFSFGAKNQAKATERLRIKLQELDRQHSGVFLDSDHAEKFHYNPDIEYSGIRPLSPKFQTRTQKTAEATLKATCEPGGVDNYEQRLSLLLSTITMAIDRNESRVEDQDRREAMQLEWKQVALVCDRILLIIFLVLTIVATCVVLMSSPHGP